LRALEEGDIIPWDIDIMEGDVVRTIISLAETDKRWLDQRAKQQGVPMTAVIREAVELLRFRDSVERRRQFDAVLKRTAGIWKNGDGLAWQRKMRAEWR
jgi:hypothetical protein